MLNEQTGWPTIPGKFSWVNSSGGLGQPTVPVLEKIGVASPPLIGSTYPLAHQQAPSTMASLYGWGAQCCWGKVTNTCVLPDACCWWVSHFSAWKALPTCHWACAQCEWVWSGLMCSPSITVMVPCCDFCFIRCPPCGRVLLWWGYLCYDHEFFGICALWAPVLPPLAAVLCFISWNNPLCSFP